MKKTLLLGMSCFCVILWFSISAMAAETIKIAAIFAKTGSAAGIIDVYDVVKMAVDDINARGGVLGKKLEVIEFDNKSTPLGTKEVALEAAKLNVVAVIGAVYSSHSLAMAPVLQKKGIPMITPLSTNPQVTKVGNYIFRVCFIDDFQGKIMANFARRDLKANTAILFTNVNSDYSMSLVEAFRKTSQENGLKIIGEDKYSDKDTDFSAILKKAQELHPDVIFIPGYSRDSGFLIKQARKIGIKATFLGGDGWSLNIYDFAGKDIDGSYFTAGWHQDVTFPKGKQLQIEYKNKYGKEIESYLPLVYDAVIVLADAIERAQSLNKKKIRDALAATKDFQGATGTITFDENRDPLNKDAVILKFEKGKTVFVKSIKPQ